MRLFAWPILRIPALLLATSLLSGCGITRSTDTARAATEQLLVSSAIDQTVSRMDFRLLNGQKVFFDPQYLDGTVDKGYLISSIRQHLLACGALLQEDRTRSMVVVEARAGGVGTDRSSLLIGVPQITMPVVIPGAPSSIPELPLAKRTDQSGVAKVAVFAYNRLTGERLWQSGALEGSATSKDLWVCGAGPFQTGTVHTGITSPTDLLPVTLFQSAREGTPPAREGASTTNLGAAQSASWTPARTMSIEAPVRVPQDYHPRETPRQLPASIAATNDGPALGPAPAPAPGPDELPPPPPLPWLEGQKR
jgi:hypothetical protein